MTKMVVDLDMKNPITIDMITAGVKILKNSDCDGDEPEALVFQIIYEAFGIASKRYKIESHLLSRRNQLSD